jgi:RNA polymerase sigma factor (sigma-70 family)
MTSHALGGKVGPSALKEAAVSDAELLAQYQARNSSEAISEIVRRHSAMVYGVCLRMLGSTEDAQDAAQAAFLILLRKARGLAPDTDLASWLFWIARNTAMKAATVRQRRERHEREAAMDRSRTAVGSQGSDDALWGEIRPHLDLAMAALPAPERQATLLRYYYGKTEVEIAREAGCGQSAVAKRLSRALDRLRQRLSGQGVTVPAAILGGFLAERTQEAVPPALLASVQAVVAGQAAATGTAVQIAEGTMKALMIAKVKLAAAVIGALLAVGGGGAVISLAAAEPAGPPAPESPKPFGGAQGLERAERVERLKAAPANTWVKLAEEPDGARDGPIFCYAPNVGQFILAGGITGRGQQHFETELFDAGAEKWVNAYPQGAPYKNESGPSDAPGLVGDGPGRLPFQTDKNGVGRILTAGDVNAYGTDTRAHHQFAFNRDDGRLYAYLLDRTGYYDPAARKWTELKAEKFSKTGGYKLEYGSLAYDPVNKEILSIGGTSEEAGGTPGTWAFQIAAGAWKKVEAGSRELKALGAEAEGLRSRTAALANLARNRFYITESDAEAKADLAARAGELAADAGKFAEKLKAAKLAGFEEKAPGLAAAESDKLAAALKALAAKLGARIASETLLEAGAAQDLAGRAARALDAEPSGRAHSQMASDLGKGQIVLFGGNRLDCFLSDTWVYDCKTRTWEQRYPKSCPSPRAGHTLAWLPKSGKVVLAGGYNGPGESGCNERGAIASELWAYDLAANEWKLLAQPKEGPVDGVGAVDTNDVLVVVSRNPKNRQARITWGCRLDPAAADAGTARAAVAPGTMVFGPVPADYDKITKPDPDGVGRILKEAPANVWTLLPKPPKDVPGRGWGTFPYDAERHQILSYGGGHVASISTDVAHYSLRTATWSLGYPAEDPPTRGFNCMAEQSFNNRPHVPLHVWGAAACDPPSGKAIFGANWTYDLARREWDYPPVQKPFKAGWLHITMAPTPKGAVCWADEGLYLFDGKARAWNKLPVDGGKVGGAYGDTSGMCYDSKRDCLWFGHGGSPMMRYDFQGGKLTAVPAQAAVGVFMRETVYLPELDMLLNMFRVKTDAGQVGNLAYDIENQKWIGLDLPASDGQPRFGTGVGYWCFGGGRSLHYDPGLKRAVFFFGNNEVLVLRPDKAGLKTFEVPLQVPKK